MIKRLQGEFCDIEKAGLEGIKIEYDPNNLTKLLKISINGPKGTPYEGGIFKVECEIPVNYPFKPPILKFNTKIYHPNVKKDTGEICKDIYQTDWAPNKKIINVIQSLQTMLLSPDSDTFLENEIANEYLKSKPQFEEKAKEWTLKYAQDEQQMQSQQQSQQSLQQ